MRIILHFRQIRHDYAPLKERDADHAKAIECERRHQHVPVWAMKIESQSRLSSESQV
ncbi:MAG TPA: hypothetical protein VK666_10150 [Chryseolinea sp.]|nr:hypothetical protein [Chryseolinea sp.]